MAPPKKREEHWKDSRSAKELAKAWFATGEARVPRELVTLFQSHPVTGTLVREAGLNVVNVGDALRPRNLNAAVKEGALFGLSLDDYLLFNPNNAVLNDLPLDVKGQLSI